MIQTTKILIREHALIFMLLHCLAAYRKMLERGGRPAEAFFLKVAEFSRRFTEEYHHYKEEYLLFSLLADKKEGAIDLLTGVLRLQHERCRAFINAIEQAATEYWKGNEMATTTLLENLAAYISTQKRHIHLENHILFKMAEKELSDEEDKLLLEQFLNEDLKPANDRIIERSKQMLDEICTRWGRNPEGIV